METDNKENIISSTSNFNDFIMITHKFQPSLILSWLPTNFKLHWFYHDYAQISNFIYYMMISQQLFSIYKKMNFWGLKIASDKSLKLYKFDQYLLSVSIYINKHNTCMTTLWFYMYMQKQTTKLQDQNNITV